MQKNSFDKIIIGAGLYGLYSALYCGKRGEHVLVIEKDEAPFMRATYINQARVHMGYHYPRSLTTAMKSAGYFKRFVNDFGFCIHSKFDQVYATSAQFSWTDAKQFTEFCKASGIKCDEVPTSHYFKDDVCDGAFMTEEYTYDAHVLRDYYLDEIAKLSNIEIKYNTYPKTITEDGDRYIIVDNKGIEYESPFVLNATYASVNEVLSLVHPEDVFKLKYELCEIILCEPSDELRNIGITVMDGPFFSIMPFGLTGLHSLTAVTFTPHMVSYDTTATFKCQNGSSCATGILNNCNECPNRPESAWEYMSHLANKYMLDKYNYKYVKSLFSMKPILVSSEVDDSRPTAIKVHNSKPTFISVLSGKINTVYDLDEYLEER